MAIPRMPSSSGTRVRSEDLGVAVIAGATAVAKDIHIPFINFLLLAGMTCAARRYPAGSERRCFKHEKASTADAGQSCIKSRWLVVAICQPRSWGVVR